MHRALGGRLAAARMWGGVQPALLETVEKHNRQRRLEEGTVAATAAHANATAAQAAATAAQAPATIAAPAGGSPPLHRLCFSARDWG